MTARITEEQKTKAIEVYEEQGNLQHAAVAIGLSVRTIHREKLRDEKFRELIAEADLIYHEHIKAELRAMGDNPNLKMPQLIAKLAEAKAHMAEYRDKHEHKVEGDIKIITAVPRPEKKDK